MFFWSRISPEKKNPFNSKKSGVYVYAYISAFCIFAIYVGIPFMEKLNWPADVQAELNRMQEALQLGNQGMARVCARRAIGYCISKTPYSTSLRANHAMAALEAISADPNLPIHVSAAAHRLRGGLRAQLQGAEYSVDPAQDALLILHYFVHLLPH
jgi:hypothetical protein